MLRFGLVGLDTSHAEIWTGILRRWGHQVAVFDDGEVCDAEVVNRFCSRHEIARCDSLEALVEWSEAAAILNCNWDRHVELARPFVEAGRSVYIDKPVAWCDADLAIIEGWADGKLVLGSCNRREPHLARVRKTLAGELSVRTGQRSDFYYGVHALEVALAVAGADPARVRWVAENEAVGCLIEWESGGTCSVRWSQPVSGFEISAPGAVPIAFKPTEELHSLLIAELLRAHSGDPLATSAMESLAAVRVYRAAIASREEGRGQWTSVRLPVVHTGKRGEFDGAAFASAYRRA